MNEVLKAARKASGVTQVDMCKALGRSVSYVPKLEQGQVDIRFAEVVKWYDSCDEIGKQIVRNEIQSIFFD